MNQKSNMSETQKTCSVPSSRTFVTTHLRMAWGGLWRRHTGCEKYSGSCSSWLRWRLWRFKWTFCTKNTKAGLWLPWSQLKQPRYTIFNLFYEIFNIVSLNVRMGPQRDTGTESLKLYQACTKYHKIRATMVPRSEDQKSKHRQHPQCYIFHFIS